MMKIPSKAQITMFVILGLVLLIVFIIILSLMKSLKPKPMSIERVLNEVETGKIKNHISNCIVDVTMDGLEKLGDNGGAIYDFEGGTIPFAEMVSEKDYLNYTYSNRQYYVAYGLKHNTLCSKISYLFPDYPYIDPVTKGPVDVFQLNTIFNQLDSCLFASDYSAYDGFFGQNTMNRLCYTLRSSGCEGFALGLETGLTLQRQLEDYVAKKLPLCVNLDSFSQDMNVDIAVESEPVIQVNIHRSEMMVMARYPLKISFPNQEPVKKIMDYQNTLQVRLGRMYNFIHDIYSKDSKKAEFNLDTDFIQSSFFAEGFQVQRVKDPCADCNLNHKYDDIIEVTDTKSLVKSRPFLFRTARENRRPVVSLIPNLSIDCQNSAFVNFPLVAYDPDDEAVSYYFLPLGFGRSQCGDAGAYPEPPCSITSQTGWCGENSLVKSQLVRGLLWIPINKYDSGKHKVGIMVVDDSGLFDYQLFYINISDSSATAPAEQYCVGNCTAYLSGISNPCLPDFCDCTDKIGSYCDEWCKISANQCHDKCLLTASDPFKYDGAYDAACRSCVLPIVHSQADNAFAACTGLDKGSCLNRMNDCLWMNISDATTPDTFIEKCIDITMLKGLTPPAYVITG